MKEERWITAGVLGAEDLAPADETKQPGDALEDEAAAGAPRLPLSHMAL